MRESDRARGKKRIAIENLAGICKKGDTIAPQLQSPARITLPYVVFLPACWVVLLSPRLKAIQPLHCSMASSVLKYLWHERCLNNARSATNQDRWKSAARLERVSTARDRGSCRHEHREDSPIELHLLFVPESELNGAPRQKRGAPGAAVTEEEKLGSQKDRQANGQSIFKRSARRNSSRGPFARNSFSQQFARSGLRTAWKYVYLFRTGQRLTRYVE